MPRADYTIVQPTRVDMQSPDKREFVLSQNSVQQSLDRFYAIAPFNDGVLLEDVALTAFTDNVVNHKLGRKPLGWYVVRDSVVPCSFEVYRNAAWTATHDSVVDVAFDTETRDDGGNWAGGAFTAPVTGLYSMHATARCSGTTGSWGVMGLYADGALAFEGDAKRADATNDIFAASVSHPSMQITKDEVITGRFYQGNSGTTNGTGVTGAPYTRMSGHLIKEISEDKANNDDLDNTLILRTTYTHTLSALWVF